MPVKIAAKRENFSCFTVSVSCVWNPSFPHGGGYTARYGKMDGRCAETAKYFQKPADKMTEYLHIGEDDDIIIFTIFL